jgi:hypothetical protein
MAFPQKPLSSATNKSGIFTELRKASTVFGQDYSCIFDKQNEMDISSANIGRIHATATTLIAPEKFYVGVHTEKLHNNSNIFSGISSRDSAIVARINCPTATTTSIFNAILVLVYDCVLKFDIAGGQVSVIQ